MAITFYTNPMSRGQIARWMLEEVGAGYEEVILDYGTTMKDAAYLSVNPMGKVPAIVHDGQVVTECAAICAYLAEAFPDAGLAPAPAERADYHRWMYFAAGPVEQAVTDKLRDFVPDARQRMMFGYGDYDRVVDVLEQAFGQRDYVVGGRFTAADVYVGSQLIWGTQFGTLPKRATLMRYVERLTARDAYRRAKARDDALIAASAAAAPA